MLKKLSILSLLATGLLPAQVVPEGVYPSSISFWYEGGTPVHVLTLYVPDALLGSGDNQLYAKESRIVSSAGESIEWHVGISQHSIFAPDVFYDVRCSCLPADCKETTFSGTLVLKGRDAVTYSEPVTLKAAKGEVELGGRTFAADFAESPGLEKPVFVLRAPKDTGVVGVLPVGADDAEVAPFTSGDGKRMECTLAVDEGATVVLQLVCGDEPHRVELPLHFTAQTAPMFTTVFDEQGRREAEDGKALGTDLLHYRSACGGDAMAVYGVQAREGFIFAGSESEIRHEGVAKAVCKDTGKEVPVALDITLEPGSGGCLGLATLRVSTSAATDVSAHYDYRCELSVPLRRVEAREVVEHVEADGAQEHEVTLLGRKFTYKVDKENEDSVCWMFEMRTADAADDLVVEFDGYHIMPEKEDGVTVFSIDTQDMPVSSERGFLIKPFTSFSVIKTGKTDTVEIPVFVSGDTGSPFSEAE